MPVYLFRCPAGKEVAGCIKNIVVSAPFVKAEVRNMQLQDGRVVQQQVHVADRAAAFRWACQSAQERFPPGVTFEPYTLNPVINPEERTPQVICCELAKVGTSQVNPGVPYNDPVGNRGLAPPPQAGVPGRSDFEDLPDAALPGNSDPVMGDNDGAAGTFTDTEINGGMTVERERPRDGRLPVRPPNTPQQTQ